MLSPKQLERHHASITGSKIGSILGENPHQSKWECFATMHKDIEPKELEGINLRMGVYAEKAFDELVKHEYGWEIQIPPEEGKAHPKYPFLWGLADRLVISPGEFVLEYKNFDKFYKNHWETDSKGNLIIPTYIQCQIFFYMILWDMPGKLLAVFGGTEPVLFDIPRDKEIEEFIIAEAVQFWDDLQNDRYPEPDASESCTKALARMFAKNDGKMILGNQDLLEHAIEYRKAGQEEKEMERIKILHGNYLRAAIDTKDGLIFPDGSKATWKNNKDSLKFNQKRFEAENPELAQRYYGTVPGPRVLRVSIKGVIAA